MKKNNSSIECTCSWCKKTHVLSKEEYNNLPESPGHQGSLFKEIPCEFCGKTSFSKLPLTDEQWRSLIPIVNVALE